MKKKSIEKRGMAGKELNELGLKIFLFIPFSKSFRFN